MRRLGLTDLMVPAIGLGTWSVFDTEEDRSWLVAEALAAGVRLFDTSPMYGRAEDCLAQALGERRAEAIVATKVSAVDEERGAAQIAHVRALYGTIDLFQIHNIVSWQLHLPHLVRLKKEGIVKAIGASQGLLVSDDELAEIMYTGLLDSIQIRYNPKRAEAAECILPLAQDMGIGVLVMQPLRWGVMLVAPSAAELAELEAESWGAAILRWILSDPRVTTVLTSTATPGRITANARIGGMPPYSSTQLTLLEAILARGPGREPGSDARTAEEITEPVRQFLAARLGACYCDACLAREFASTPAAAGHVRKSLPNDHFVNEIGPCLACGETTAIARSKTIMR